MGDISILEEDSKMGANNDFVRHEAVTGANTVAQNSDPQPHEGLEAILNSGKLPSEELEEAIRLIYGKRLA